MIHDVMSDVLMMYRETRVLPPKFLKIVLKKEGDLIKIFEGIIARGVEKISSMSGILFLQPACSSFSFRFTP